METPEIRYPCRWQYKVIGYDKNELRRNIAIHLLNVDYTTRIGHKSRKGTFITVNVDLWLNSEEERLDIYNTLCGMPGVSMVL